MLPGPSERYEPVLESVVDEDMAPNPCEEDEEFFKFRSNAEELEQVISKFHCKTSHEISMTWKGLPSLIEIIIYQAKLASGIQACCHVQSTFNDVSHLGKRILCLCTNLYILVRTSIYLYVLLCTVLYLTYSLMQRLAPNNLLVAM